VNTNSHRGSSTITRVLSLLGSILLAAAMLSGGGVSSPATAAPALQCNGVGGGGGEGYDCEVTITNQYDVATGIGTSTVRTVACNGPANTDPLPVCIDSGVIPHAELTLSVNQCNGTIAGNGGSLYCSITMTNTIVGAATTSIATVNQCDGSLGGGGTVPGSVCDPIQLTTGATITQCNGSVNGGGGYMVCTVGASTTNSAFPVALNQCNGSAEGTGNLMVCSASISTVILPAADDNEGGGGTGGTGGSGGSVAGDELAATGVDAQPGALIAGLAMLLGAVLLAASKSVQSRQRVREVTRF